MGIFGWSYPPGCSGPPDNDGPCDVCGYMFDQCICPECEICGEFGDHDCYTKGHLVLSDAQREAKIANDTRYEEQCRQERECEEQAFKEHQEFLADCTKNPPPSFT